MLLIISKRYLYLAICLFLGACATSPKDEGGPIFYPPLPNPPRLQHLISITTMKDLGKQQKFLEFVLGKETDNEAIVTKPYGVAINDGKIYVVDTRGPGYVVIDLDKNKYKRVDGGNEGRMRKPINITIDEDGNKYVTDTGRNQVLRFDTQDKFMKAYGVQGQFKPADVAIVKDRLYVSDLKNHMIQVLSKKTGKLLFKMATTKQKKREAYVHFPTNLSVYEDKLYISDTGNFKIVKYSLDGKYIDKLGTAGSGLGQFARPKGIALDRAGNLYVVDAAFENVQIFNKKNKLLLFFGGPGYRPDNLNLPTDITIDYENVDYFQKYAAPGFKLEYIILVTSQFGANRINVYGFGKMKDMDYTQVNKK